MSMKNTLVHKKAFTLIELLVVIAIISILAAILFPVFARARENARRASCLSNEKQIALGFMMYTQDYDGRFPQHWGYYYEGGSGTPYPWSLAILPYVKSNQLFFCPSDTNPDHNSSSSVSTGNVSYGYNYAYLAMSGTYAATPATLNLISAVKYPSETLLLGDTGLNTTGYVIHWSSSTYLPTNSHLEGCNFAFVDGHVKWMKAKAVIDNHATPALSLWGNRP